MLMSPMFEHFLQKRMLPWADLDDRLAAGNDEYRIASIARAHYGRAGHKGPGVEHLGDLGDLAVIHGAEQRHAGNHAPG